MILDFADDDIEDNLKTSDENSESILTDTEVLGEDSATYSDLANEINQSGNIKLTHKNYIYDAGATAITITEDNKVIDGDGAVIDMAGSTIRAFTVTALRVTINNLTIKNANLDDDGGAIYFNSGGTVTNCNFTDNAAKNGGAIYCYYDGYGTMTNCTFTNNKAIGDHGGAVWIYSGTVTDCNFIDNNATQDGGAVFINDGGKVTNCNFADNSAAYDGGGAMYLYFGSVSNCNFTDNSAYNGGAIYGYWGSVSDCNFADNDASYGGGAIYLNSGNVTNSNFIANTASKWGGALFFSKVGDVSKCNFIDNVAPERGGAILSMEYFNVIVDTCIFKTSSDTAYNTFNLSPILNVDNFTIYSEGKLKFDLKTNRGETVNNGNISISVYYRNNDSWVGNYSCLSGEAWIADLPAGLYYVIFNTEYAEFSPINRSMTIVPNNTFYTLNYEINIDDDPSINLTNDFYFDPSYDRDFVNGIVIARPITINGNGYTINANGKAHIFDIVSDDVVLNNITFANANATGNGGAVFLVSGGEVMNCSFINNTASGDGGAVMIVEGSVKNCIFSNNSASGDGGAIWICSSSVEDCIFTGNSACRGGAVHFNSSGTVTNCSFTKNTASVEVVQFTSTVQVQ